MRQRGGPEDGGTANPGGLLTVMVRQRGPFEDDWRQIFLHHQCTSVVALAWSELS